MSSMMVLIKLKYSCGGCFAALLSTLCGYCMTYKNIICIFAK